MGHKENFRRSLHQIIYLHLPSTIFSFLPASHRHLQSFVQYMHYYSSAHDILLNTRKNPGILLYISWNTEIVIVIRISTKWRGLHVKYNAMNLNIWQNKTHEKYIICTVCENKGIAEVNIGIFILIFKKHWQSADVLHPDPLNWLKLQQCCCPLWTMLVFWFSVRINMHISCWDNMNRCHTLFSRVNKSTT